MQEVDPKQLKARELTQKLDILLTKAAKDSTRLVDMESIEAAAKEANLGRSASRSLASAAREARKAMKKVMSFTGRQIASAFVCVNEAKGEFDWNPNSEVAKAILKALDAQATLSMKLTDLANSEETISRDTFDTLSELSLQCDRRQSEITALVLQIAESVVASGNNPEIAAMLDRKLSSLMPAKALSMHGNADMLVKVKDQLQPLADRLEAFAARPNSSITSQELMAYSAEVLAATATIQHEPRQVPDGRKAEHGLAEDG